MAAAPAPDHARPAAAPGLLADIVLSKYDDHRPLYRQAEIFARDRASLETSTPVGATAAALQPLFEALAAPSTPTAHRPRCRLSRGRRPPGHRHRS
jgi:transposase